MKAPRHAGQRRAGGDRGFTLVEMLVAMTIMLLVVGTVFSMVDPGHGISKAQPEVADMQQRMRVAADVLQKDLIMAGAGTYSGAIAGALANFLPPILPYRTGTRYPSPGGLQFSPDAITIVYVPDTAAQTSIRETMPQPSSEVKVQAQPGCPAGAHYQLCGFEQGMQVMIFDNTGAWDVFTVTEVQDEALALQHRPPINPEDLSKKYTPDEDARITQVQNHVYWLNQAASQLVHYDGFAEELPVVDNTVGLRFTYFGDPNPPLAPRPKIGFSNCIVDAAGHPLLPVLASGGSSLVELTQEMLTDGPPCGSGANPFDADLFRIRKVRVELRVQAGLQELRGANPAGKTFFVNPGTNTQAYTRVPDYSMTFEVTPRNMNLVR